MDRHTHAENVDVSNTIHQAGRQAPYIIFSFIGVDNALTSTTRRRIKAEED
jgi:hypothetical protein